MSRWLLWLPLAIVLCLLALVASELRTPSDRTIHSALVGKPIPDFALPALFPDRPAATSLAFRGGKPRLLNVFASWCVPCVAEAPQLMKLRALGVPIDAIAIRDTPQAVRAFLSRNGDPYQAMGDDRESRVQLSIGSSGVPETFVIDGQGRILLQHIGDIRDDDVARIAAAAGVK